MPACVRRHSPGAFPELSGLLDPDYQARKSLMNTANGKGGRPDPHAWQRGRCLFSNPGLWTAGRDQKSPLRRCFKPLGGDHRHVRSGQG